MARFPSPYYYVPFSDKVFQPDWADMVSMDVPFSDGISGTITVKVTAKTPIHLGNGAEKNASNYGKFFQLYPEGPYAINGTSFKGMLRNVIEIASFGKFKLVEKDRHHSFRELRGPKSETYLNKMTLDSSANGENIVQSSVKTGWLTEKEDGRWEIYPCDYARIEIEKLVEFSNTNARQKVPLWQRQQAERKYDLWNRKKLPLEIGFTLEMDGQAIKTCHKHTCDCDACRRDRPNPFYLCYKKVESILSSGKSSQKGIIVFTGQPASIDVRYPRGYHRKKHMEFVFYDVKKKPRKISEDVQEKFLQVHEQGASVMGNWQYWKNKMREGERVPVFYLSDTNGNPTDIGLAQMFRLACPYTIGDMLGNESVHVDEAMDLVEILFGTEHGVRNLKGRIHCEPLTLTNPEDITELRTVQTIQSSHFGTFYPASLQQETDKTGTKLARRDTQYKDYNSSDAKPRGIRRYATSDDEFKPNPRHSRNENMAVKFTPLDRGAVFGGDIHVHNLQPKELGALLWALTWGGNKELRHLIGKGKPFGFGSVTVEIDGCCLHSNKKDAKVDLEDCINKFTKMMENWANCQDLGSWLESPQIRELLALANPKNHRDLHKADLYRYPIGFGQNNEFIKIKKDKNVLPLYTEQLEVARNQRR